MWWMLKVLETVILIQALKKNYGNLEAVWPMHIQIKVLKTLYCHFRTAVAPKVYQGIFAIRYNISVFIAICFDHCESDNDELP